MIMGLKDFTITEDGRIVRDSFVFYRSWYDTIKMLSKEKGIQLFNDISEYGLNGKEPVHDDILTPIFTNIKPNIDANNKKALNGGKGGRPKNDDRERESDKEIERKKKQAKEILKKETDKTFKSV